MAVGIAVLATNLVAAVWGAIGWVRKDARASIVFWPLLRAGPGDGRRAGRCSACCSWPAARPRPTACTSSTASRRWSSRSSARACAWASRSASSRASRTSTRSSARSRWRWRKRVALGEMGVMTVGALLILTLALRAFQTGG